MRDESNPPSRPWSLSAAAISLAAAGLLGLSAGANVDNLFRPTLGPTGATVAGFATALAVLVVVGVVSYRGLTR